MKAFFVSCLCMVADFGSMLVGDGTCVSECCCMFARRDCLLAVWGLAEKAEVLARFAKWAFFSPLAEGSLYEMP